jgi:hypothetical protein
VGSPYNDASENGAGRVGATKIRASSAIIFLFEDLDESAGTGLNPDFA